MSGFILAVVFLALLIGTYTDIRKREVPDWLNYGLVVFGIGANALLSISLWSPFPLLFSLAGLAVFFGAAYAMYYTGQWGGGDSKMLMGLGASVGLPFSLSVPFVSFHSFMVAFWFNMLLAGVVYALVWASYVAFRSRKKFLRELKASFRRHKRMRRVILAASLAFLAISFLLPEPLLRLAIITIAVLSLVTFYLSMFSRAVERAGMIERISPSKLTEGDWIAKDVVVSGRKIAGPRDLGVSKKQIRQLQKLHSRKKLRFVTIKIGIPFVPSFLAAFLMTYFYGNVFSVLLSLL